MPYRVVYDVTADSPLAGQGAGLYFLGMALAWTVLWISIHLFVRGMPPERRRNWRAGAVVGGILIAVGICVVATETYPTFLDQSRCKRWARAGEFRTVEGPVAQFVRENGKNPPRHFRVGEIGFTYRVLGSKTGGFRGDFTAPGTEDLQLRDGLRVRIAHRDGRILRIEVAD